MRWSSIAYYKNNLLILFKLLITLSFWVMPLHLLAIPPSEARLLQAIGSADKENFLTTIYAVLPYYDSIDVSQREVAWDKLIQTVQQNANPYATFYAQYLEGLKHKSTSQDLWTVVKVDRSLLKIAKEKQNNYLIVFALRALGLAYKSVGDYEEAYKHLQEAMKMNKESGDKFMLANEFLEIGDYYYIIKNYEKAVAHYQQGLRLPKQNPNQSYTMNYLNTIGICFVKMQSDDKAIRRQQLDSAIYYYQKSLAIAYQINRQWIGLVTGNIGFAYYQKGDLDKASEMLKKDVEISIESGFYHSAVGALASLSRIAIQQNKLEEAESYIDHAVVIADEHQFYDRFVDIYKILSDFHKQKGNYETAYNFYSKHIEIRDSLDRKINKEKIEKITQQYEIQLQDEQIKALQKEQQLQEKQLTLQQWIIVIALLGLVIVMTLLWLTQRNYLQKKQANLLLASKNEEVEQQQEELLLQSNQLQEISRVKNLLTKSIIHDLKTPLSVILHKTENEAARQAARQMQNMVLNMLEVEKLEEINMMLQREEENLQAIVQNSIRQVSILAKEKEITIKNLIDDFILVNIDNALIERVFMNLLTNAINYSHPKGEITVQVQLEKDNFIYINVIDQGTGIPDEYLPYIFDKYFQVNPQNTATYRSSGLGLTFCKMVVEAHGGQISAKSKLEEGTIIAISLPLVVATPRETVSSAEFQDATVNFKFNPEEIAYLQPFALNLQTKEIEEYSNLRRIIYQIDEKDSQTIRTWKEQMMYAIHTHNEMKFKKMLELLM